MWYFVLSPLSAVPGSRRAALRPDWLGPCNSALSLDANTLSGPLLRLGMMAGAEGQEASHASSSHWESRLLQGHLYRRPDWAHWKVGRVEGDEGGGMEGRRDMWKGKGSERLDDKEVFTFF